MDCESKQPYEVTIGDLNLRRPSILNICSHLHSSTFYGVKFNWVNKSLIQVH